MDEPDLVAKGDLPLEIERMSRAIIGCAIEVHRTLGPGLLERLYEDALAYELRQQGMDVRRQVEISIPYKAIVLDGLRLDLVVGDSIIIEVKSIAKVADIHLAQLLSYLRAVNVPLGLLLNFNTTWLRDGLHRVFNERCLHGPHRPSPLSSSLPSSPISPSNPSRSSR